MFEERIKIIKSKLNAFKSNQKSFFLTSSFQTQSLVLLKIISDFDNTIPVYFLNTGYHFPETIAFKSHITNILKLNTIDVFSEIPMSNQLNSNGRLLYTSDTDFCCELNKTIPLQKILTNHDIWITGIRRDQSMTRKTAEEIEILENEVIKYNPIHDWERKNVMDYLEHYQLPKHPLDPDGLLSIGCQPCTRLVLDKTGRQNRWFGQTKTECGIHLNFKQSK
jgi:phosphoadenosine phosphosulfate reductase